MDGKKKKQERIVVRRKWVAYARPYRKRGKRWALRLQNETDEADELKKRPPKAK